MSSNIDRRQYDRYPVRIHTEITTPQFYIALNTIELSVDGLRVEAYSEIPPSTEVTVTFDLKKEMSLIGKVIWVIAVQKKDVLKYRIGIKINKITESGCKISDLTSKTKIINDILKEVRKLRS